MRRLFTLISILLAVLLIAPGTIFSLEQINDDELGEITAKFSELPQTVQLALELIKLYQESTWLPFAARPISEVAGAGSLAQSAIEPVAGSAQAADAFSATIYEAPTLGGSLLIGVGL